jgi:hypothetical protein
LLSGTTVTLVHEPTKNTYSTQTNGSGYYYFFNLKPGGPYTITVSYSGYITETKQDLYFNYSSVQDEDFIPFVMRKNNTPLEKVVVTGKRPEDVKTGTETNITEQQIRSLPSISRNLQDYIRLVPQAKVSGDGMMSLAGQPGKYNAVFIDGSSSNDPLGLAQSGTNVGQTESSPISPEAIEEIKVSLAPYNAQYSDFTGGSINIITRSGTNQFKSSAWYFFRNEQMAGRSPVPVEKPGSPGIFERSRLSPFFNQTAGIWAGGPVIRNKLFYFLLFERQDEKQPQPFILSGYRGNSTQQQLGALTSTMQDRYGYDPGSFLELNKGLSVNRFIIKLDWNPSLKNKLTFSFRYNYAERTNAGAIGGTSLRFSNNAFVVSAKSIAPTIEWKSFLSSSANNRLLVTFTNQTDDRNIIGKPFPSIEITDGAGSIFLGNNSISEIDLFKSSGFGLLDVLKLIKRKHVISAGAEMNYTNLNDLIVPDYFGYYRFGTLNDFITNAFPADFKRTVSLMDGLENDHSKAGSRYSAGRLGLFINDDVHIGPGLQFSYGIRVDGNALPARYRADVFFNDVVRPALEKYYPLDGAVSGQTMKTHWQIAPRLGFVYKPSGTEWTIRGGAGLFTGHILNLWASEIYDVNTSRIDISPSLSKFNPDPFNQPSLQSLGIDPVKSNLTVMTRDFKYPVVFRTSINVHKKLKAGWGFSAELLVTKNIHETRYTNINLLPPGKITPSPDIRNVFSTGPEPEYIAIPAGNPYNTIYLLSNNHGKRGSSYNLGFTINKTIAGKFFFTAAYSLGRSWVVFEPTTGTSSSGDQWGSIETVNGKNFTGLSISDYDLHHRVYAGIEKTFAYAKNKASTRITIFYNGQSGSPFSYVYNGSIVNDNGPAGKFDLIYIPTGQDLSNMVFLPNTTSTGQTYTPQQQKDYLNRFIENDQYLRKHRGQFAERNGARLPFTHVVDLRLQQDFKINTKRKEILLSIIYDVFNFTNMLNRHWGRVYFMSRDNYPLITFAGFSDPATLTPQYQFTPPNGTPWSIEPDTAPGSSARWTSQLGIRISL